MENEDYNPETPKYYNYKPKQTGKLRLLQEDFTNYNNSYNNTYICAYDINNDGKYPFQRFVLTNDILNESLVFPQANLFKGHTSDDVINFSKVFLFGLLMLDNFETFDESVEFNGYFYDNHNDLYLFYDITKCKLQINDIEKHDNNTWLALLDEIVNCKHVCNMKVDDKVTHFFNLNEDFCFLLDEKDDSYEIPVVSYVGKPENKLNFTYTFGETMSNKNGILGPFYYFTDYFNAFEDAFKNADGKKVGVVRFAAFVGTTKYFENFVNDDIDDSEIKSQRLEDSDLDQAVERLTMRISDHDGKWAETYDSAYLGYTELDNGSILKKPIIVLKEYNQQIPLSYHYVNKKTYKNEYLIC